MEFLGSWKVSVFIAWERKKWNMNFLPLMLILSYTSLVFLKMSKNEEFGLNGFGFENETQCKLLNWNRLLVTADTFYIFPLMLLFSYSLGEQGNCAVVAQWLSGFISEAVLSLFVACEGQWSTLSSLPAEPDREGKDLADSIMLVGSLESCPLLELNKRNMHKEL